MLDVLRHIVQEVNAAKDLNEALQVVVSHVCKAIDTQACTVYLVDSRRSEFVMMATEGLNKEAVGKLRVGVHEGLIGLIGQREEPVNLEDAPAHPSFYVAPLAGEERFKAFLGAPIIHQRHLLGVIVVQQEEKRRYDEAEEAFLVTMSAQLGGVIARTQFLSTLSGIGEQAEGSLSYEEASFGGMPSVPGVAIGRGFVVYPPADLASVPDRPAKDIDVEIGKFNQALDDAREEMQMLRQRLGEMLPAEEQLLFDAYLKILDHSSLGKEVVDVIRQGQWAQGALRQVIKAHVRKFEAMEDPYLRERGDDVKDLGRRVLSHLQTKQRDLPDYPEQTILVGDEVTAGALAEVPEGKLVGVVSTKGSSNSHVAILCRALGVPTVMGAEKIPVNQLENIELIVDGYYGHVYVAPTKNLLREFAVLAKEEKELDRNLEVLRGLPAKTPDGHDISLHVNTGLASDASRALSIGAEGVGLFRTEIPFLTRERFPGEDEQRIIYRQLLAAFAPRMVTMRTLDIGGDKALPYFPVEEDNPFLGWRGIRITLDHPEVFLVQVRAMMRANADFQNLRIMLPMITSVTEVEEAVQLINQAHKELIEEGVDTPMPEIGVMIEVPAAVYQAQTLAKRVDFLSVGSNDLTQYILAVDRNNSRVANLYDSLHPAVLRALMQVVAGAHRENKTASICGEMAGEPAAVILLLAMGFDVLSMSSTSLLRMKWVIRNFTMARARELLTDVLAMDNPAEIRCYLELVLEQEGLGGLIRAGK